MNQNERKEVTCLNFNPRLTMNASFGVGYFSTGSCTTFHSPNEDCDCRLDHTSLQRDLWLFPSRNVISSKRSANKAYRTRQKFLVWWLDRSKLHANMTLTFIVVNSARCVAQRIFPEVDSHQSEQLIHLGVCEPQIERIANCEFCETLDGLRDKCQNRWATAGMKIPVKHRLCAHLYHVLRWYVLATLAETKQKALLLSTTARENPFLQPFLTQADVTLRGFVLVTVLLDKDSSTNSSNQLMNLLEFLHASGPETTPRRARTAHFRKLPTARSIDWGT